MRNAAVDRIPIGGFHLFPGHLPSRSDNEDKRSTIDFRLELSPQGNQIDFFANSFDHEIRDPVRPSKLSPFKTMRT